MSQKNPKCEACDDSGFVRDAVLNGVRRCHCAIERIKKARTVTVIGPDYQPEAVLTHPDMPLRVERYVINFDGTGGLVFLGEIGAGKSYMASAIVNHLLKSNCKTAAFVNIPALLQLLSETAFGAGQQEIREKIENADIAVFDDIGAGKPSEWSEAWLYNAVASRYSRNAATLVTTNCQILELEKRIGARTLDRILGFCGGRPTVVDGGTRRWARPS